MLVQHLTIPAMPSTKESINTTTLVALDQIGLRRSKSNYAREILSLFIIQSEELLRDLLVTIQRANHELVRQIAHKLKGGAQGIGAVSFERHCQRMQDIAEAPNFDAVQAEECFRMLSNSYSASVELLNAAIDRAPRSPEL